MCVIECAIQNSDWNCYVTSKLSQEFSKKFQTCIRWMRNEWCSNWFFKWTTSFCLRPALSCRWIFRISRELLQCRPLPIDAVHADDRLAVSGSCCGVARELDELEEDNGDFISRALMIQVSCLKPSQNSSRLSFPSLSWKRWIWRINFQIIKTFF